MAVFAASIHSTVVWETPQTLVRTWVDTVDTVSPMMLQYTDLTGVLFSDSTPLEYAVA